MIAAERRESPRRLADRLRARVRFADLHQLQRCYLKDLSRGGIFLRTKRPAALGTAAEITLELPDGLEIELTGSVVHVVPPARIKEGKQPGVGVKFADLTPKLKKGLEMLLSELPKETAEPATPSAKEVVVQPPADVQEIVAEPPPPPGAPPTGTPEPKPPSAGGRATPRPGTPRGGLVAAGLGVSEATAEVLRGLVWRFADTATLQGLSYYALLGVSREARPVEICAAAEALRRALELERPPAGLSDEAKVRVTALVALVSEAEACLCDATRRQEHDRQHQP